MSTQTQITTFQPSQNLLAMAEQCKAVAGIDLGIARIFVRATKVNAIRAMMAEPEMQRILVPLAGSPAGFYLGKGDEEIVKDSKSLASVVTEALSRGARLDGGEFTVMKGRAFLNKAFYQRQLDELGHEGSFTAQCKYRMMWWDRREKEIITDKNQASVTIEIEYKLFDKDAEKELDTKRENFTAFIKTFPTDTPDKWVGQSERRAFQKLLRKLSAVDFGDDEETAPAADETAPAAESSVQVAARPEVGRVATRPGQQQVSTSEVAQTFAQDALKNLKGEAVSTKGPANPAPAPQVEDAQVIEQVSAREQDETVIYTDEQPAQETAAAQVAPTPQSALERFYAAHKALKEKHGLPACKLVIVQGGFKEDCSPSRDIAPLALTMLAERMERILAGKDPVPTAQAVKPAPTQPATTSAPQAAAAKPTGAEPTPPPRGRSPFGK